VTAEDLAARRVRACLRYEADGLLSAEPLEVNL